MNRNFHQTCFIQTSSLFLLDFKYFTVSIVLENIFDENKLYTNNHTFVSVLGINAVAAPFLSGDFSSIVSSIDCRFFLFM